MKERRRFIRFEEILKVRYIVQEKDQPVEKSGATKNLNAEGIQLVTNEPLAEGDSLELKIALPKAPNPVHIYGLVIWSEESKTETGPAYNSGIKFIKVEEDNKNTFLRFLCELMSKKSNETKK